MYLPVLEKAEEDDYSTRHRRLFWLNDTARNHMVAMIGEFVGTFMFLFFSFAAAQTANSKPALLAAGCVLTTTESPGSSVEQLLYISVTFGISLAVNVWIFFRVSGGMFNPAVTFGLCLVGAVPWVRGILLLPVQLFGGIAAAFMVSVIFPGDLTVGNSLGNDTSVGQGLVIEMFITSELIFAILMLAVEKHRATFLAPLGIGMALFLGHMVGVNFTGAAMNPARALGPAVVLRTFPTYHWIYWAGPVLGAILAAALHATIKFLEYETANPGQDDDGRNVYNVVQKDAYRVLHRRHGSADSFSSVTKQRYFEA